MQLYKKRKKKRSKEKNCLLSRCKSYIRILRYFYPARFNLFFSPWSKDEKKKKKCSTLFASFKLLPNPGSLKYFKLWFNYFGNLCSNPFN